MENKDTKKDVNPSLDKFFLNAEDKNQDLGALLVLVLSKGIKALLRE
jgi:hypothetical protein